MKQIAFLFTVCTLALFVVQDANAQCRGGGYHRHGHYHGGRTSFAISFGNPGWVGPGFYGNPWGYGGWGVPVAPVPVAPVYPVGGWGGGWGRPGCGGGAVFVGW